VYSGWYIDDMKTQSPTITIEQATANLAANVARLMTARGITQSDLADAAGISQGWVSKIASGQSMPNAAIVARIAARLRTTSEKLLDFPPKS